VSKIKTFFIAGIIFLILGIVSDLFCGYKLYHDGGTTDGITATNIELTAKLVVANNRIKQLEKLQAADRGTIDDLKSDNKRLTASRNQLESAYRKLRNIVEQQGSSISSITGGNDTDSIALKRLQEIIAGLPKEN
jgi:hypothetical protein